MAWIHIALFLTRYPKRPYWNHYSFMLHSHWWWPLVVINIISSSYTIWMSEWTSYLNNCVQFVILQFVFWQEKISISALLSKLFRWKRHHFAPGREWICINTYIYIWKRSLKNDKHLSCRKSFWNCWWCGQCHCNTVWCWQLCCLISAAGWVSPPPGGNTLTRVGNRQTEPTEIVHSRNKESVEKRI